MKIKKRECFIILILLIILTSIVIIKPLNDLDEIWNYNFSKNIVEGNMPYKDFSMITMPLLPNLCAIFLSLLGNELIVMRILAILLCTFIIFLTYKILELLAVNKWLNYSFLIFLIYLFNEHFRIDYNFFVLFITLAIIYIELKTIKNNQIKEEFLKTSKKDVCIGILSGLCICSKQTTGIIIAIVSIFYNIYYVSNLKEFKLFAKKAVYRIIGVLIPVTLLAIYFTYYNLWNDFIDYCILGISTFSNYISYYNLLSNDNIFIKILSILVPIFLIIMISVALIYKYKKKEFDKKLLLIIAYSIAEITVTFPISDPIHFLVGAFPVMIGIIYSINIFSKRIKNKKIKTFIKEYLKAFNVLVILVYILISIILIYNYAMNAGQYVTLNHFKYILQSQDQISSIKNVEEYIQNQNKNVYILDAVSALYTIPINQYTKNYDMFMKGNLGAKGEEGIIENLKEEQNYIVLIKNEQYNRNWQNPEKVRKYIVQNMNNIGEIDVFDIYEKY